MNAGRYIVGNTAGPGYRIRQWSSGSFTVECRDEILGLIRDRQLGSYSTEAEAREGLERMKREGIKS